MKMYQLNRTKGDEVSTVGVFATKKEAAEAMLMELTYEHNEGLNQSDEDYLTPFDFILDEIESKEINEVVTDYETAKEYLCGKPNADFTVAKKILSGNSAQLEDVSRLVKEVNPKHVRALVAYNRLCTIAQAWNKEDDFTPDFSNRNQDKWFPWFRYSDDVVGFVYANTTGTATIAYANVGSRLCFKTPERAMQFGKQFIDLWNEVLL